MKLQQIHGTRTTSMKISTKVRATFLTSYRSLHKRAQKHKGLKRILLLFAQILLFLIIAFVFVQLYSFLNENKMFAEKHYEIKSITPVETYDNLHIGQQCSANSQKNTANSRLKKFKKKFTVNDL